MKVLLIAFNSAELCIRIANGLSREVDVCLMLPRRQAEPCLHWIEPRVNFVPFDKPRLRQPWLQIGMIRTLLARIAAYEPDVVHLQKGHLYFGLILPYLRRKYPLVISIHDPRQHIGDKLSRRTPQFLMDFAYRQAHRVIAHNEQMKEMIVQELRIPAEHIHVTPLIALGDPNPDLPVAEEEHQVLFFGRIWAYKGLDYLIRAEPLITKQVPDARIVIAGRGDDLAPYRKQIQHPEHFTIYEEWISNEKRAELFKQCSVVVLPYIEATQSGVIPVAYTHAKPVVASNVGGLPAQVEHERTGLLVPPRDERALADAVVRLLLDQELRRTLGANGKRKLEMEWSESAVARQTVEVYRHTIQALQREKATDSGMVSGRTTGSHL